MYVCMYVCMSVCLYVCMSVCLYVCMSVCLYVCMSVCLYACMYVCMYVCVYCIYIYMCVCIYMLFIYDWFIYIYVICNDSCLFVSIWSAGSIMKPCFTKRTWKFFVGCGLSDLFGLSSTSGAPLKTNRRHRSHASLTYLSWTVFFWKVGVLFQAMLCYAIAVLSFSAQNCNRRTMQTVWLRWSPWILMPWKRLRSNWRTFLASVGLQLDQARPEMSMQCTDCCNSSIHLYMDGWLKDRDIMYQLVRADMAI